MRLLINIVGFTVFGLSCLMPTNDLRRWLERLTVAVVGGFLSYYGWVIK